MQIKKMWTMHEIMLDQWYIQQAREEYSDGGKIQIDSNAEVNVNEEGAYVQAWVWVGRKSHKPTSD